ncbi:MAG: polyketide cyclase / dehydrase and lipid transport [Haloquadratum walsbyi J07HQW1]|uniref:Polyketide cyclase / dehydrase and lipid transport n=1 Tax=Haloquadratum walsbyi J07HQW1 TaxID=1238424 RepID=U1N3P4_9EURY|nr:MAG: polyketide cyclase / dehydrase and lipid transport [Haloquadratum walsbyi J07HQW1]
MDELVVSTVVYRPRNEVYDFLIRFPQYAAYSDHLREVLTRSESKETEESNTRYGLKFAWWKLTYTVESEVTDTNRPHTIDWRIVENLNAHGRWRLTKIEDDSFPLTAPDAADVATRVTFEATYDPDSANKASINLPRFISFGWVIDRLEPAIRNEAKETVERVVADLEGRTRPVELTVEHHPT